MVGPGVYGGPATAEASVGEMVTHDRLRLAGAQRRLVVAALETLAVYLFAAWAYVAAVATLRPGSLATPLWHDLTWLRRDTAGAVAFAGSMASYACLQVMVRRTPASARAGGGGGGGAGEQGR